MFKDFNSLIHGLKYSNAGITLFKKLWIYYSLITCISQFILTMHFVPIFLYTALMFEIIILKYVYQDKGLILVFLFVVKVLYMFHQAFMSI